MQFETGDLVTYRGHLYEVGSFMDRPETGRYWLSFSRSYTSKAGFAAGECVELTSRESVTREVKLKDHWYERPVYRQDGELCWSLNGVLTPIPNPVAA